MICYKVRLNTLYLAYQLNSRTRLKSNTSYQVSVQKKGVTNLW